MSATTQSAIAAFQSAHAWTVVDGRMTPDLFNAIEDAALAARFQSGHGVVELHRMLQKAVSAARLNVDEGHLAMFQAEVTGVTSGA